jgi:hypothetical protein
MATKDNYEAPFSSQEEASRLTASVASMLENTSRTGTPSCEATSRGGTHSGKAAFFVRHNDEREDQVEAVCSKHLSAYLEHAARIQAAGGPSREEQLSYRPITPETGRAHQERRAIEGVETRLSLEEPLRAYYGDQQGRVNNGPYAANALWARENQEVGRPGPLTDREKQGETEDVKGAVEKAVDSSAVFGGRQPTPDTTAVDKYGRGLYVDKGPGYVRGGQWHPGGVTRLYRFEKENTSPQIQTEEELAQNKSDLADTLVSQAKRGVKQPKNSKKVPDSPALGSGSGTMDDVIKTYKAGGDYKAHAESLGLSEGDVDFHINRLGQTAVNGGRFVKGGGRSGGAVAVPIGSQEDIDNRFDTRSTAEVAAANVAGAQSESSEKEEALNASAARLRRVDEFRKNFETK